MAVPETAALPLGDTPINFRCAKILLFSSKIVKLKIELTNTREIRAEKFVAEKLPFLKRTFLQKLFRKREIKVAKIPLKAEAKIAANSVVEVFLPDPRKFFSELTGNQIIFEDKNVIAFAKRAGLTTHAGVGTHGDDLRSCAETLLNLRLTVVHRLDRATSGIVIFAKNAATARKLEEAFRARQVFKKYFAVVAKLPRENSGEINLSLKKVGPKMEIAKIGLAAQTFWKVVKRFSNSTLLEVEITTGRTHQIRAHLAAVGMPIVGDSMYGKAQDARMLLHAGELKILDYNFSAEIPPEFYAN